ncbi:pleckstrin homology domain-containing family A member 4-like isoform X6 [Grus americana]|uniref:pleckstrin homology domain-containing family A member 4-like isoform X6 n=1 Tax=Grus americana TaxID=9117 RepID=UPI002407E82E|nr:pleckstrin homology domain-containing family A member 4-like isoform X6 [Grus americana]
MADGEEPPRQAPAGPRGPGTQPCRPVPRVHAFGKGGQALRRDPRAPPAMRGWLHKQDSSGLRLWKRRWFVLVDLCLYYYRDSGEQRVRGGLPLPGYEIRVLPLAPRAPRFLFTAEHPGMRTYCLGAETPEELNAWVCALRRGASPLPGSPRSLPLQAPQDHWSAGPPSPPLPARSPGWFSLRPPGGGPGPGGALWDVGPPGAAAGTRRGRRCRRSREESAEAPPPWSNDQPAAAPSGRQRT